MSRPFPGEIFDVAVADQISTNCPSGQKTALQSNSVVAVVFGSRPGLFLPLSGQVEKIPVIRLRGWPRLDKSRSNLAGYPHHHPRINYPPYLGTDCRFCRRTRGWSQDENEAPLYGGVRVSGGARRAAHIFASELPRCFQVVVIIRAIQNHSSCGGGPIYHGNGTSMHLHSARDLFRAGTDSGHAQVAVVGLWVNSR